MTGSERVLGYGDLSKDPELSVPLYWQWSLAQAGPARAEEQVTQMAVQNNG